MQKKSMRFSLRAMLCLFVLFFGLKGWGQPWNIDFGNSTGSITSGSSAFYSVPSGTQYTRIGTAGGSFNLENQSISFGTLSYLRGVASTSTSYNFTKVSGFASATSVSYVKFKVLLGSATGTNSPTTGTWHFVLGNGTSFTNSNNSPAFADYCAGIRWTFGASGALTTATIASGAFTGTISGFSQATTANVEIYINNSVATVNYTRNAVSNSMITRTYDLWVDGILVQNDQPVNTTGPSSGAAINAWMFYGGSSTSNVANIFIDDLEYSNTLPAAPINNYYSKPSGNLDQLSTWTDDITLAGGNAPANFTTDNQVFNIRNNATPTIDAAWTVSGANSKIVVGDGTNAINFTIPPAYAVTGTVDVSAQATLHNQNTSNPTFGTLASSSTIVFAGGSAQSVPAASYGNLSVSATGGNATAAGAIAVAGALTIASGSTFDLGTNALTGASLTTSGTGNLQTANTTATPIPGGRSWSMTVAYNSSSPQTVVTGTYASLNLSGGNRTLASGTISIPGTYTPGNGTLTVTGNTIDFAGAALQTIPAAVYNNITNTGNGDRTFASSGSITIGGSFSTGNGNYNVGTSTVVFSGANQAIPKPSVISGGNYFNVTLSGSGTTTIATTPVLEPGGALTVNSGATLDMSFTSLSFAGGGGSILINGTVRTQKSNGGISGSSSSVFDNTNSPTVTFALGSTVEYYRNSGGTPQEVSGGIYGNLLISTTGLNKQLTGDVFIRGGNALTVNSDATLHAQSFQVAQTGSGTATITINGTLVTANANGLSGATNTTIHSANTSLTLGSSSTIDFSSASTQVITSGTYAGISNSGNGARSLGAAINISGAFSTGSGIYAINTSTVTFNGAAAQTIPVVPVSSGSNYYNLSKSGSGSATLGGPISVANDVSVSDGTLIINNATSNTFTVMGSISQTGGMINHNAGASGAGSIVLFGNLSQTSGSITTGGAVINGLIVFAGSTPQTLSLAGTHSYTNYRINDGAAVTLLTGVVLTANSTSIYRGQFTVGQGASGSLNTSTFAITSSGTGGNPTVTINAGATVSTAHVSGLNSSIASSNMTRVFTAGANYIFNAATTLAFPTAGQQASFGNPNNVTVNANISLSRDVTITGDLNLTDKVVTNTGNTLTLSGTVSRTTGNIAGTGTTAIVGLSTIADGLFASNTAAGLTINRAGGVSLTNNLSITGALTFTSGKLSIGSNTLTLSGTTTGGSASNSLIGGSTSNLIINGTGALGTLFFDQTTDGTTNAINNFTLNRTSSGAATLGNKMVLLNTYTPTAGVLTAGGFLHLRSTASNTARIAAGVSGGGYITGNVVTERYISGIGIFGDPSAYNRAYRMLTPMVTTAGTINANWQEGQTNPDVNTIVNTNPGYGTQITGAGGAANGFDPTLSNSSSLYTFNAVTPSWVAATNTNVATLNAKTGYLLYIRGNRSMDMTSTASPLPATNTTLRATGTLLTGTQTFASLQGSGKYNLVTNPFASPVDWASIYGANSTDFENYYTFWDPNQGSRGAFVTVTAGGTVSAGDATTSIQSGQAFFVKATAGAGSPTLTVSETHKTTGNNIDVFRNGSTEQFRTSLYFNDGFVRRLADGVVNVYDNIYSAEVDGRDALQMANWDEDIAIVRNSNSLSIETRPLIDVADTIFLSVARLKQQPYQWQFDPSSFNAPGLQAYLQDKFLNNETPVSLSAQTLVDFTVTTDAASAAADRFRIVFRSSAPLPVKITKVKATDKQTAIQVEWNTLGEFEMDKYLVEKSTDGREFVAVGTVLSKNMATATTYTWLDANRVTGSNYYRIRSISKNGQATVSEVVRVNVGKGKEGITVYPNPIEGDVVAVQLNNVASGKYSIVITNKLGQQVSVTSFDHAGGSASQTISLPKAVTAGIYQLQVIGTGVKYELQIIKN